MSTAIQSGSSPTRTKVHPVRVFSAAIRNQISVSGPLRLKYQCRASTNPDHSDDSSGDALDVQSVSIEPSTPRIDLFSVLQISVALPCVQVCLHHAPVCDKPHSLSPPRCVWNAHLDIKELIFIELRRPLVHRMQATCTPMQLLATSEPELRTTVLLTYSRHEDISRFHYAMPA